MFSRYREVTLNNTVIPVRSSRTPLGGQQVNHCFIWSALAHAMKKASVATILPPIKMLGSFQEGLAWHLWATFFFALVITPYLNFVKTTLESGSTFLSNLRNWHVIIHCVSVKPSPLLAKTHLAHCRASAMPASHLLQTQRDCHSSVLTESTCFPQVLSQSVK